MKRSTKLSLDVIFSLGLITSALSIGRVATMNYGVWATDSSCELGVFACAIVSSLPSLTGRAMPSETFSLVEEKCGIIFASAPALRQLYAYIHRVRTGVPTKDRQYPNEDFTRFRRRVNLRDIFWYRQPLLNNGRVVRPQQMFHPSTSDQVSEAEHVVPQPEMEHVNDVSKNSMLDVIGRKVKRVFGARPGENTEKSRILSASKDSNNAMKTRLWHWNSLGSQSDRDTTNHDLCSSDRAADSV